MLCKRAWSRLLGWAQYLLNANINHVNLALVWEMFMNMDIIIIIWETWYLYEHNLYLFFFELRYVKLDWLWTISKYDIEIVLYFFLSFFIFYLFIFFQFFFYNLFIIALIPFSFLLFSLSLYFFFFFLFLFLFLFLISMAITS